jgi:hypothetical protein
MVIQLWARLFVAACVDSAARSQPLQQELDEDFIMDEIEEMNQVVRFHDRDPRCHGSPHSLRQKGFSVGFMHVSHIINTALTAALTILLKRVAGELTAFN